MARRIHPRVAQTAAEPRVASTITGASSTAPSTAPTPSPTQDEPLVLLSIAESLLSKGYTGTSIPTLAALSFPTTVVIGSQTFSVLPKTTADATTTHSTQPTKHHITAIPTPTGLKASNANHNQSGDKRLAIIIGVAIGLVAFAIMGVLFFCLYRRRRDNGSFFLRRTTPSMRSTSSWRSWMSTSHRVNGLGNTTYVTAGPAVNDEPKYPRAAVMPRSPTPPLTAHPAFVHSRSMSDENPFYTPQERSTTYLRAHEIDGHEIEEMDFANEVPQRRSSHSLRNSRAPTPFSPLEFMTPMPGPASQPHGHQNPFRSPEDEEAEDIVSPIVPPTQNNRRSTPMVHYPSWDEVSAFSFSGDERDARHEDGGDGWRPGRERRDGRYELA